MKFLIAFAAVTAVAIAVPVQRSLITPGLAGPAPLVDENGAPISIGPAIIDFTPVLEEPSIVESPISVGPAIIETNPISIGPEIIDFPVPDGGVVTAVDPTPVPSPVIQPSPVVIGEIPAGASPLVQIIVNVNQQQAAAPIVPAPVIEEEAYVPGPVNVVDNVDAPVIEPIVVVEPTIPVEPIQVVEPVIVEPVIIGTPVVAEPIIVGNPVVAEPIIVGTPVVAEPVIVGTPIIPAPAVVLPDILN